MTVIDAESDLLNNVTEETIAIDTESCISEADLSVPRIPANTAVGTPRSDSPIKINNNLTVPVCDIYGRTISKEVKPVFNNDDEVEFPR